MARKEVEVCYFCYKTNAKYKASGKMLKDFVLCKNCKDHIDDIIKNVEEKLRKSRGVFLSEK